MAADTDSRRGSPIWFPAMLRELAMVVGDVRSVRQLATKATSTVLLVEGQQLTVLAKRTDRARLERELLVYESVLPGLGLPGPSARTGLDHEDGPWLVIDFIPGRCADLERPDDRRLVAHLLARLHTRSQMAEFTFPEPLPGRAGPRRRIELLEASLQQKRDHPAVSETLLAGCHRLRECLPAVLVAADALHPAFSHGDIAGQNLLITDGYAVAVDWERSGLMSPAIDIGRIDLAAYADELRRAGSIRPSPDELVQGAIAGQILADLTHRLEHKSLRKQKKYLARMLLCAERLVAGRMPDDG